jgi:tyrosyl-tRNA synthetase
MSEYMHPPQEAITPEFAAKLVENAQIRIPEDGVYEKLRLAEQEGRPLRIKMGFDPTSPDLHLGHAVSMKQLGRFQELGHTPVIIIGDFTGRIGDPSGKNKSRPLVDSDELSKNAETYFDQLEKVLDTSKIEVRYNSEWLESMSLSDVIHLLSQGSLAQVISRDDFRARLDAGSPIALHEIIYPLLQGTDSVQVAADIEVGGVDQLYAFQAGRLLQNNQGEDPQALVLMPLLRGLDGEMKMSKTLKNYIGLTDAPRDMFGKVMSIPDTLIEEYLRLASDFTSEEVDHMLADIQAGKNPMDIKLELARNITSIYHDSEVAQEAQEFFNSQFRTSGDKVEYTPIEVTPVDTVVDLLIALGTATSKSQARRLIEQGGVTIDDVRVESIDTTLTSVDDLHIKVGKRRFFHTKASK